MAVFKCKMCGGTLEVQPNSTVAVCDSCGSSQTIPAHLDDERRANLYDRANHFRRNNEFDKATTIYEQILNEDNLDAEAYWSLVLCKYGVSYVEDPVSHKRVPTVNRAQYTSIYDDENYKSALKYADGFQNDIYTAEAKAINEIQKGILEISQNEEPFDVFICYKETDSSGRRTKDSVLANDLYHQLTQEGFKVFFSRITLEDKLGVEYEPYIFAALNSSKVMVVIGTKPEYFNAVWVKNEWSRYLALIKGGVKKTLIPAYKDMDPYDLPEEFSHLQAQDMSKLGFMQDLIRGIKKIASNQAQKQTVTTVVGSATGLQADTLVKRAFMFLEDGDWNAADEYCEKALDIDPECAKAYLGKLLAEWNARNLEQLKDTRDLFDKSPNYNKYMHYASKEEADKLKDVHEHVKASIIEEAYIGACDIVNTSSDPRAIFSTFVFFKTQKEYKKSAEMIDIATKKIDKLCCENIESKIKDMNSWINSDTATEEFKQILDDASQICSKEKTIQECIKKGHEEISSSAEYMNKCKKFKTECANLHVNIGNIKFRRKWGIAAISSAIIFLTLFIVSICMFCSDDFSKVLGGVAVLFLTLAIPGGLFIRSVRNLIHNKEIIFKQNLEQMCSNTKTVISSLEKEMKAFEKQHPQIDPADYSILNKLNEE